MSAPGFDPRRDAAAVITRWWLRPGERVCWIRNGTQAVFEVPGRAGRGRVLKQSGWRTAGRRALAVAEGAVTVLDFFSDNPLDSATPPALRVFGTRVDCQAAVFAEPSARESSWVLTEQRFALLRVTGPDEPPRVEAEIAAGRFGYHPRLNRKRVEYDCVAFADGSVIDFIVGPEPKR